MIAWFRGEFAAANAIIDALCGHLVQIGEGKEYEAVFAAIHRRRLNWIPVLHMQKYYSIADVTAELRLVAANAAAISFASAAEEPLEATPEEVKTMESGDAQADEDHAASEDTAADGATIAVDDEAAAAAAAEEPATGAAAEGGLTEGGRVGLEEEAAPPEVCSGDSSGHKSAEDCDVKGGDGVAASHFSRNPRLKRCVAASTKSLIDASHCLARPERIKISKGFVAKEAVKGHMPYFKPPHLDNPISTLLLSETTMAFGRSLVIMRGNSAEMARHVVCASPNKRMIITFVKVRSANHLADSPAMLQPAKAMTLWQPAPKVSNAGAIAYGPHGMIPAAWGLALRSPVVMLAPPRAIAMSSSKKAPRNGTGVFLPWMVGPKKYTKHLPPRIQKRRLPSLPSPLEAQA
ncbi:hypothetical protein BHE74_00007240 [Ensete ventricosum]|nr:hypothetical protein BHE74_00007240 [Ensete ventricosum]